MQDVGDRVAIIGAGWSGLAAAVTLANRGLPVAVLEASRSLGGRARRVTVDGTPLDNGQHILIGAYRESLSLMRKVGADPGELLLRMPLELRFAGGFHLRAPALPYPANLLVALLAARGLSLAEALAAIRFVLRLRRDEFRIDPDRSVADLLQARGQAGALSRYLWGPLCVSALNTVPGSASAQVFAHVVRDGLTGARGSSDLLLPRADLGRLFPDPAAAFVVARGGSVETGVAVRSVARDGEAFRLDDRPERFAGVILACAPQNAAALLSGIPGLDPVRRAIESLAYEPIYTCYLQYSGRIGLPAPMLGFADGFIQWAFDRGRLSGMRGLIAAVASGSGAHQEWAHAAIAQKAHAELAAVIRDLPAPVWSRTIAEKRATFSCRPALLRPLTATGVPGLFLAGDYVASEYPGTLEAAVRSGIAAARAVAPQSST